MVGTLLFEPRPNNDMLCGERRMLKVREWDAKMYEMTVNTEFVQYRDSGSDGNLKGNDGEFEGN